MAKNTPCERQEVCGQRLESEQEKQVRISSLQSCLCSDSFERVRLPLMSRMSVFVFMLGGY